MIKSKRAQTFGHFFRLFWLLCETDFQSCCLYARINISWIFYAFTGRYGDAHRIDLQLQIQISTEISHVQIMCAIFWILLYISKKEVSKDHNVPQMEERLQSSPSYLKQMERAHKIYGKQCWKLLTPQDQTNIIQRGWRIHLKNDWYDCVKCLHVHVARYLVQDVDWAAKKEERQVASLEVVM